MTKDCLPDDPLLLRDSWVVQVPRRLVAVEGVLEAIVVRERIAVCSATEEFFLG